MVAVVRKLVLFLLDALGLNRLGRYLHRRKAMILWYHGITADSRVVTGRSDDRSGSREAFLRQLHYLRKKGYRFVTLTEMLRVLDGPEPPERLVTLTFDDALENVVTQAYPIMKELGAKGCVYVVSDYPGTDRLLWPDTIRQTIESPDVDTVRFVVQGREYVLPVDTEDSQRRARSVIMRLCHSVPNHVRVDIVRQIVEHAPETSRVDWRLASWEQLRSLDRSILEIGAHTKTHPCCNRLTSDDEIHEEVVESKLKIEREIGAAVEHFAYPFGAYNDAVRDAVKQAGYSSAVSILSGFNDRETDRYLLKRICVREEMLMFKAGISGCADAVLAIRNRLARLIRRSPAATHWPSEQPAVEPNALSSAAEAAGRNGVQRRIRREHIRRQNPYQEWSPPTQVTKVD
jgi:peptidoglycan/xylan/chitin deacetylase (PgdA/CDA1 family)